MAKVIMVFSIYVSLVLTILLDRGCSVEENTNWLGDLPFSDNSVLEFTEFVTNYPRYEEREQDLAALRFLNNANLNNDDLHSLSRMLGNVTVGEAEREGVTFLAHVSDQLVEYSDQLRSSIAGLNVRDGEIVDHLESLLSLQAGQTLEDLIQDLKIEDVLMQQAVQIAEVLGVKMSSSSLFVEALHQVADGWISMQQAVMRFATIPSVTQEELERIILMPVERKKLDILPKKLPRSFLRLLEPDENDDVLLLGKIFMIRDSDERKLPLHGHPLNEFVASFLEKILGFDIEAMGGVDIFRRFIVKLDQIVDVAAEIDTFFDGKRDSGTSLNYRFAFWLCHMSAYDSVLVDYCNQFRED